MNKEKEIETVTLMVRRYCRGVHGTRGEALCPACAALLEYARAAAGQMPARENLAATVRSCREAQGGKETKKR